MICTGGGQNVQLGALVLGIVNLGVVGAHLLARAPVDHIHLRGAQAQRGAAGVEGGETAADDDDARADLNLFAQLHGAQEVDGLDHARRVLAR